MFETRVDSADPAPSVAVCNHSLGHGPEAQNHPVLAALQAAAGPASPAVSFAPVHKGRPCSLWGQDQKSLLFVSQTSMLFNLQFCTFWMIFMWYFKQAMSLLSSQANCAKWEKQWRVFLLPLSPEAQNSFPRDASVTCAPWNLSRWPDLANNGHPIEFDFQIHKLVFRIIVPPAVFGTYLYCKFIQSSLKCTFNWHLVFYLGTVWKS